MISFHKLAAFYKTKMHFIAFKETENTCNCPLTLYIYYNKKDKMFDGFKISITISTIRKDNIFLNIALKHIFTIIALNI